MCFSASASFSAAGILGYIGFLTNTQACKKEYAMVAGIPFLFALQQMAEGTVWLTMLTPGYQKLYTFAVYSFLIFALSIWPSWIPISLWRCEEKQNRKKWLSVFSLIGLSISCYTLFVLMNYPVQAQIFNCSIWYVINVASVINPEVDLAIYTLAAVGPFFISSLPLGPFLGSALLVSLFFTYIWMYATLISVWCFFAALLSIFVYLSLRMKFPTNHLSNMQLRQTS